MMGHFDATFTPSISISLPQGFTTLSELQSLLTELARHGASADMRLHFILPDFIQSGGPEEGSSVH